MAEFGERARRHMAAAGVSLRELARRTHYDAGHLSKVLAGRKPAAPDLAARLDDALAAGGELAGLAVRGRAFAEVGEGRLAYVARHPRRVDKGAVDVLAGTLAQHRRLEDSIGSAPLLEPTVGQLRLIEDLVTEARGPVRPLLVDVAAQWAQFAGWLHIATEQPKGARGWLDRAAEYAVEADNSTLFANALSFKGHLAWLKGQPGPALGLSQAAQRDASVHVCQLAYDAYQEARGHTMTGDIGPADRKLARARERAERAAAADDTPPWSYYYTPSLYAMEHGLVCRLLGRVDGRRNADAAAWLGAGLDGLDEAERGSEWAAEFMYHLALVHAQAGEPERSCAVVTEAAGIALATRSARASAQVRSVYDRLARHWPDLPEVAELGERLRAG